MKRLPESGSDEESASSDNETMALVKAHKKERKDAKQRKRGAGGNDGAAEQDDVEPDEGNLFIFDKRSDLDGSRRVTGVDGEEGASLCGGCAGHATHVRRHAEMQDDVEADLGMKVEPFHLRDEMDKGHFTEEGHYVERNFGSTRDAWLDEMDEEEHARKPRTAAGAHSPTHPPCFALILARRSQEEGCARGTGSCSHAGEGHVCRRAGGHDQGAAR